MLKFILKGIHVKRFHYVGLDLEVIDEEKYKQQLEEVDVQVEEGDVVPANMHVTISHGMTKQKPLTSDDSKDASTATTDPPTAANPDEEIEAMVADPDIPSPPIYPLGSVLLHVHVTYESEDTYEITTNMEERKNKDQTGGNFQEYSLTNRKLNAWTFTGCISGHVELDYIVTKI